MEGEKLGYKKGLWTEEEDNILIQYINLHSKGRWNHIANNTGLKRGGKSCRLRWMNYLSPTVKRGIFSEQEEDLIIRLHNLLGNRWSLIAKKVPGRTDNQVKNYWNTHLTKKLPFIKKNEKRVFCNKNGAVSSTCTSVRQYCLKTDDGEQTSFEEIYEPNNSLCFHEDSSLSLEEVDTNFETGVYDLASYFIN